MTDILEILQTLGICVGAIALTVIAFILVMLMNTLFPPALLDEDDVEEQLDFMRATTYDPAPATRRKSRKPSKD